MRINDAGVRQVALELSRVNRPISDAEVLRLLAALGDRPATEAGALLEQLSAPGVTRRAQLELVQQGLDADELADVGELLASDLAFSPAARNFLEALAGRAALDEAAPLLQLDGTAGGLSGLAAPGAVIEAVNLSTAAAGFARNTDAVELGRADAQGRFRVFMGDAAPGDRLRVRARGADGRATDWFAVSVDGQGQGDWRAAFVSLSRVVLRPRADGQVELANASKDLPVSEPGATVRFANPASGWFLDVTVGDDGRLPPGLLLNAKPGDTVTVAVSDGAGNTDFSMVAGTKTVPPLRPQGDVVDPGPVARDRGASTFRAQGSLFVSGVSVDDVKQGQIGDCYVPAAAAAIAHADPKAIEDAIRDNGDGTYTARFFVNGTGEAQEVTVDADLYGSGSPKYGGTTARDGELWFSLLEKAYAAWRGDYDVVAQGGSVGQMMSALLGRPNVEHWLAGRAPEDVYREVLAGVGAHRAMAAGTYGTVEAARYTNSGLYANHAYSVLGAGEENGQRYVVLRNPWGSGEVGFDGRNDGVFRLPLERFVELFQVLNVT